MVEELIIYSIKNRDPILDKLLKKLTILMKFEELMVE